MSRAPIGYPLTMPQAPSLTFDDFRSIRQRQRTYIDKTSFIETLLPEMRSADGGQITLFCRPADSITLDLKGVRGIRERRSTRESHRCWPRKRRATKTCPAQPASH